MFVYAPSRLLKKAHLRRRLSSEGGTPPFRTSPKSLRGGTPRSNGGCGRRSSLQRTSKYVSLLASSCLPAGTAPPCSWTFLSSLPSRVFFNTLLGACRRNAPTSISG